jgi:hypothetical protein
LRDFLRLFFFFFFFFRVLPSDDRERAPPFSAAAELASRSCVRYARFSRRASYRDANADSPPAAIPLSVSLLARVLGNLSCRTPRRGSSNGCRRCLPRNRGSRERGSGIVPRIFAACRV